MPRVAQRDPKKPPSFAPTKVAMFMAIGPGVDSATAIISISVSSLIHPFESIVSRMMEIMAYPPPNENAPILKKVKNKRRNII